MNYKTEQESFWAASFGTEYIERNASEEMIIANIHLFSKILKLTTGVQSILELGCNVGMNLHSLHRISNKYDISGVEINEIAAKIASKSSHLSIINTTILSELKLNKKYDLTFTKNVMIHINPLELDQVYANLYNNSKRYILVCEYYNPTPVSVDYRGHKDRLFKRDFAGEMIDKYNLRLIDYGFNYHRDDSLPQDDATWFLLSKN